MAGSRSAPIGTPPSDDSKRRFKQINGNRGGSRFDANSRPDPPERAMRRCWLTFAAAALVTGAYAAQVAGPAAETSPAPIAGIAPSYGPKTVSAVPNAAAVVRRIWLPGLDAGYDPQGLAVDGGGIYVSAYRSDSFGVRRGPCRVIRIDLETGGPNGYGGVPSPCGAAGGLAVGGDGLWIARSDWSWGTLDRLDPATGAPRRRYETAPGIEGIAFGSTGRLWAVSEAGSRHIYDHPFLGLFQPFFPLVFALDLSRLE